MTFKEAIEYLQPVADNTPLSGYGAALTAAIYALHQMDSAKNATTTDDVPCALCGSKWIDIEVRTVSPDDMYVFSTNKVIGLMYCPLCGRRLKGGDDNV